MTETADRQHTVCIDNRKELKLTGVTNVVGFGTELLVLDTELGRLTVKGEHLKILGFHRETGDFSAEGTVFALAYAAGNRTGGKWKGLFR